MLCSLETHTKVKVKYHGIYFKVLQKKKKERKYLKILTIDKLGKGYYSLLFLRLNIFIITQNFVSIFKKN